ncbi:MAG: alanine dehydrogenase, partial [Cytophagales bacterium]|nr:alanine dehydrogenase [Cytophagales bacterium]
MATELRESMRALAKEAALYPQESLLAVEKSRNQLFIGIPKETTAFENRVPLTPESVSLLIKNGHEVWIETGAGSPSKFSDRQ